MRKMATRKRPYFTMESAMTAILRDASGKMHHGILFDRRLGFTRIWYTGRIRRELLLKSTISGVPTTLTPYPFPSLFFLLTSFSVCSLHGPHKLNATGPDEFFTCATRLEGTCKFSIDCNTVCSSKTLRFRGSHVKKRRIRASFWPFKNL